MPSDSTTKYRVARPGLLAPSSKSGRTRGSTILANMAGGSDVYRDARLAYVRSQQRGVVEEAEEEDDGAAVVEL